MVVMVACKNCGHEYKSEMLQTPDEETLRSEPHEDIMENCPVRFQAIVDQIFIGNDLENVLSKIG
jgi:hypothetical protein